MAETPIEPTNEPAPITVHQAVALLNRALAADPEAISALVLERVPCAAALAADPTIQVASDDNNGYSVGLLGIMNGLFGVQEGEEAYGWISATIEFSKEPAGLPVVTHFFVGEKGGA